MNGASCWKRIGWARFLVWCSLALAVFGWPRCTATARAETSAGDDALFQRLDANHDGQLAVMEVPAEHKQLFARLLRRADTDGNKALSREEFLAGMVPSRPEKPLEPKQPDSLPQADAVRYLLLSLDTSRNSVIEASEVPSDMRSIFETMLERMDSNKSGNLERNELNQGGPRLAQIAGRYVQQERIDAAAELKKLRDKQGAAADRFDVQRMPFDNLGDPQQVKETFAQLDGNGDGQIELKEVPEPLQRPLERMLKAADRDGDGKLSEREFTAGAKRIAERQAQMTEDGKPARKSMTRAEVKSKDAAPSEKQ
jgi:Ca2+-binding EF-hand superfamily protein